MKTQRNTIAYLGKPGSFSHIAAEQYFVAPLNTKPCSSFYAIFSAVADGTCTYGIVPIENTLTGSLYENYDNLSSFSVSIVGETYVQVEHALLTAQLNPKTVTTILSHPKALEQCSQYLKKHKVLAKATASTTHAAATVASQPEAPLAAIAHPSAAARYGLYVNQRHIENNSDNYTRFLVICRDSSADSACDKATIRVVLAHEVGSLSRLLECLREQNINLTKIESRPVLGKPFEYQFYLDMHCSATTDIRKVIAKLRSLTHKIQTLGVYPSGQLDTITTQAQ